MCSLPVELTWLDKSVFIYSPHSSFFVIRFIIYIEYFLSFTCLCINPDFFVIKLQKCVGRRSCWINVSKHIGPMFISCFLFTVKWQNGSSCWYGKITLFVHPQKAHTSFWKATTTTHVLYATAHHLTTWEDNSQNCLPHHNQTSSWGK